MENKTLLPQEKIVETKPTSLTSTQTPQEKNMETKTNPLTLTLNPITTITPVTPLPSSSLEQDVSTLKSKFLELLRSSGNVRSSVRLLGVSRSAIYKYRKSDREFAKEWNSILAKKKLPSGPVSSTENNKKIRKAKFIESLLNIGSVKIASRLSGISRTTAYSYRKEDAEFARSWDNALISALDAINDAGMELGVYGVKRQVYNGDKCVRYEKEISESVLITLLRYSFKKRFELIEKAQAERQHQKTGVVEKLKKYFDDMAERKGNYD